MALFDTLLNQYKANEQAFSSLKKPATPSYAPGPMSTPSYAPGGYTPLPSTPARTIPSAQAQAQQQTFIPFTPQQAQRAQQFTGRTSTTAQYTPGVTYTDIMEQIKPGAQVGIATEGVQQPTPQPDTGRAMRANRDIEKERANLSAILEDPRFAGMDIKALQPGDPKRQLLLEELNLATYGVAKPQFAGDVAATEPTTIPTETQDITATETATETTTPSDVGAFEETAPGYEEFKYERERVPYESFYEEYKNLAEAQLQNQLAGIDRSSDRQIAEQQEKDATTIAQTRAFFGAAGANRYGYSPNELQYVQRLEQKAEQNVRDLEAARQADKLNAMLGVQSNIFEAKKADIEAKREVDMFNITSGVQQAQSAANIQKTLVDIQKVKSDIAGVGRDEAQQIVNDAFKNVGGGAFEGLNEQELAQLEKKAGYPTGFLTNATTTLQELEQENLALEQAKANPWKYSTDQKGNVTAYRYDAGSGEFQVKVVGPYGKADKWAVAPTKSGGIGILAGVPGGEDIIAEALAAYTERTGNLAPTNNKQREQIVKDYLASQPQLEYPPAGFEGPPNLGEPSPTGIFAYQEEPKLDVEINQMIGASEAAGEDADTISQAIRAMGGDPADYGY